MEFKIDQIILSLLTGFAILFVGHRENKVRRWGQLCGLVGQPFWIYATFAAQQWPIVALSIFTSYAWIRGAWTAWIADNAPEFKPCTCPNCMCGGPVPVIS